MKMNSKKKKSKQAKNNNQNSIKSCSKMVLSLKERIKEELNILTIVYVNTNS